MEHSEKINTLQQLAFDTSSKDDQIKFLLIFGKGLTNVLCHDASMKNDDGTLVSGKMYALPIKNSKYESEQRCGDVFDFLFSYIDPENFETHGIVFTYTNCWHDDLYMEELAYYSHRTHVYFSSEKELCKRKIKEYPNLPPRIIEKDCITCGIALECEKNTCRCETMYYICHSNTIVNQHFKRIRPFIFELEFTTITKVFYDYDYDYGHNYDYY